MRSAGRFLILVALLAAGCGGPSNQPMTEDQVDDTKLYDVAEVYRLYAAQHQKPPMTLADFAPMERMSPMGLAAIRSGEVVVRFGATLPDTGEAPGKGPGDEVLAYMKQVPESGGKVLMLNRTIQTMTAEEFKAAKLAGNASSAPEKTR